jgi:hypothetical protein
VSFIKSCEKRCTDVISISIIITWSALIIIIIITHPLQGPTTVLWQALLAKRCTPDDGWYAISAMMAVNEAESKCEPVR